MTIDSYLHSSIRWMDVILKISNEKDTRRKWHETTEALYNLYPDAESPDGLIRAVGMELPAIIESAKQTMNDAKSAASHTVILMWWLDNFEAYYHTQKNNVANTVFSIGKVLMGPVTIAVRWMSYYMQHIDYFKELSIWFNSNLKDDMIAFSRGHTLHNFEDFKDRVRKLKNKLTANMS